MNIIKAETSLNEKMLSNVCKHLFYYLCFCFSSFLIHSAIISVAVFFHLILDHKMEVIDDWIYNHGWVFLIISKISSVFIVLKVVNVNISFRDTFRKIKLVKNFILDKEILVGIAFIISFFVYLGEPVETTYSSYYIGKMVISFLGITVMYLTDIFLFHRVENYYPLSRKVELIIFPVFSLIFFFSFKWTYMYGKNVNMLLIFIFLTGLVCSGWQRRRFINSAWYIVSISLVCTWYGIDPMWGKMFSPAEMRGEISLKFLIVLLLILLGYLKIKSKSSHKGYLVEKLKS